MKTRLLQLVFSALFFLMTHQTIKSQASTWSLINKFNSGLPSDTVNVIAIDKNGVKWIGTENGLAKFDGTTWTVYKKTNSGIPSNKILSIAFDTLGNKWIGTRGFGAAMFDGSTWTVFNSSNSLILGRNVGGIAVDTMNNKWIASNMLTKLGPNNQSVSGWSVPYCSALNNLDTILNCIAVDVRDIKWIGSSTEGVYFCSNIFSKMNVGPLNTVVTKGSAVWYGGDYGFFISGANISCGNFSFGLYYPSQIGLKDNKVSAITFDDCGYAWIGTKTGGLGRYTGTSTGTLALTTTNTPLPTNQIKCLLNIGNQKWIGTTRGISILNTACAYSYTHNGVAVAEDNLPVGSLQVYPNPSSGKFTLVLPGENFADVSVYDGQGKEVLKQKVDAVQVQLDLSGQANGIYFIRATENGGGYSLRIVKE